MSIKIGVTGDNESFTHLAAKSFFTSLAPAANYSFFNDLKSLFKGLGEGHIEYAITALESSSYGTIHAVYDKLLLSQGRFTIVGEIGQIEQHCLCVKSDFTGTESDLVKVFSHPHIMECCNDYLETIDNRRKNAHLPPLVRGNTWDSAASCREVTASTVASACICSKEAAELHGLKILTSSVGNYKNAEVSIFFDKYLFALLYSSPLCTDSLCSHRAS
jgi:prephenate dehydratase